MWVNLLQFGRTSCFNYQQLIGLLAYATSFKVKATKYVSSYESMYKNCNLLKLLIPTKKATLVRASRSTLKYLRDVLEHSQWYITLPQLELLFLYILFFLSSELMRVCICCVPVNWNEQHKLTHITTCSTTVFVRFHIITVSTCLYSIMAISF